MKKILSSFLPLLCLGANGQLTFTHAPRTFQLYPRSLSTNNATVSFNGAISASGYSEIKVDLYRNNIFTTSSSRPLNGIAGENFNLSMEIQSELVEYKFVVSLKDNLGNFSDMYTADNVVAGDAIIIQGQSNAVATGLSGSSAAYNNEFIRVYGSGDPSFPAQVHQWYLGQGDGDPTTQGNTGQWGIIIADSIVTRTNHPAAVFNGGLGGQLISYFLPNTADTADLTTNYGRLLTRVREAGLENNIRAIFWYQGESNAASNTDTDATNYKSDFNIIRNAWIQNFPSTTNFYIAQIRFGCLQHEDKTIIIKEAQREVAAENANTRIYGTAALTHYIDNCHYPFQEGYEKLGQDICGIVLQDLYNFPGHPDSESPFVKNITSISPVQIDLMLKNSSDNIIIDNGALNNFYFEGATVQPVILSAQATGNKITLTLNSQLPSETTGLTYAELHQNATTPDITNGNRMAMVNFFNMPIIGNTLPIRLLSFGGNWKDDHTVELSWRVENESNINGYEVEYSSEGSSFINIGFKSASNISLNHIYTIQQNNVDSSHNYYRLKIIETDGRINYSPVIMLHNNSNYKFSISVIPNPAKTAPTLIIETTESTSAEITVINSSGQKMLNLSSNIQVGLNNIVFPDSFPKNSGVYYISVRTRNSFQSSMFIVHN